MSPDNGPQDRDGKASSDVAGAARNDVNIGIARVLFHVHRRPLFAIVAIGYLLKVRTDLRKRGL